MTRVVLLLLLIGPAQARPRIAVLELRNSSAVGAQEARYFGDLLRRAALKTLAGRALVITRENILAHLPPGTDLAACEGSCEIETARNVGADFVVSGEILKLGAELRVLLKAHETRGGAMVASEKAGALTAAALEGTLEAAAIRVFTAIRPEAVVPRTSARDGWHVDWDGESGGNFPKGYGGLKVYEALSGKVLAAPTEGEWQFAVPFALPDTFELTFIMGGDTRNQRARCVRVTLEGAVPTPIHVCPHPTDVWVLGFDDSGVEGRRKAAHDHPIPVRIRREARVIKLLLDDMLVASQPAPASPHRSARVKMRAGPLLSNGVVVSHFFESIRLRPVEEN